MAITDNLVAYYKLDETSGTTATDEKATNNGTASNARVFTTQSWGIINKCADFNQGDDWIDCGNNASLGFGTGAFSVSFWVNYASNTSDYDGLVTKIAWAGAFWDGFNIILLKDSGQKIEFRVGNGAAHTAIKSSVTLTAGVWYHVAVTRDNAGVMKLYVNGVDCGNAGTSSVDVTSTLNLMIGRNSDGTFPRYCNALIDEVAIWRGRALSPDEVKSLSNVLTYTDISKTLSTYGTRWLDKDYPFTDGLTAITTSQTGHKENIVATNGTFVPRRIREGLD